MTRTRTATSLFLTVSALFVVVQGCNTSTDLQQPPQSTDGGSDTSTGGSPTVGPQTSGGSNSSSGGATGGTVGNTGGAGNNNTGGTPGNPQGGNAPTGGKANNPTGGTPGNPQGGAATGGSPVATGGSPVVGATGGSPVVATGGSPVVGATGGTTATSTSTGNTGTTVTFAASGKASGAMTGWAFVAMGLTDTVSVPTCGTAAAAITSAASCSTTTNWPAAGVCVTGSVPPNPTPYTSWGINVGVSSTDPAGSGLGQAFAKVAIAATGAPAGATFRYIISVGTKDYCAVATVGTAVTLSTFNTLCYDSPPDGTAYAGTGSDITGVQLQVVPGTAAITVTNLCLTGITFS